MNKVYSTLVQEESVRTTIRGKEDRGEVMGFAVQAGSKPRGRGEGKDKNIMCINCGRIGHEANSCFQLIGYPEWWGDRPRGTGKGTGHGKGGQQSSIFGGRGRGGAAKANAAQALVPSAAANATSSNTDKVEINGLSGEQWQTLVNLLNAGKIGANEKLTGKNSFTKWIIDTGASHHMTGQLEHLMDVRDVLECPVGLPYGKRATATKEGTVLLTDKLKLTNVLYVPSLSCNLISVSQLIDECDCVVQLTNKFCAIQGRTSRMLIGAGEQREGLYYCLQGVATAAAVKTGGKSSFDLWHKRLGHPSSKVIELVPNAGSSINSNLCNKACDVCLRAKQTRDCFPISENKTTDVFQLIHCDLWGPYRTPAFCGARYFLTIIDEYSRGVWIYLLIDKKEVFTHLCSFIAMVER